VPNASVNFKTLQCVCLRSTDCHYDEQTYLPAVFEKSQLIYSNISAPP